MTTLTAGRTLAQRGNSHVATGDLVRTCISGHPSGSNRAHVKSGLWRVVNVFGHGRALYVRRLYPCAAGLPVYRLIYSWIRANTEATQFRGENPNQK
jgi:hypothetical protein